jgi:hypothetical protein
MSIIDQLKPKQYDFKHDGVYSKMNLPLGNHYGLIAQDVEKILPNLVKNSKFNMPSNSKDGKRQDSAKAENESMNFKSLNYTEFIPILIKAVQEQQQTISDLQQQINDLKTMVTNLAQGKPVSAVSATSNASVSISNATLEQNVPNPLSNTTSIRYNIPTTSANAQLMINDFNGKMIKQLTLQPGAGVVNIDASTMSTGAYSYTLVIDGKAIATKKMIIAR